jgi:hypothetical protein
MNVLTLPGAETTIRLSMPPVLEACRVRAAMMVSAFPFYLIGLTVIAVIVRRFKTWSQRRESDASRSVHSDNAAL